MRKPRTTIILLTAIVVVLAVNSRSQRSESWARKAELEKRTDAERAPAAVLSRVSRGQEEARSSAAMTMIPAATVLNSAKNSRLSDEANSLVSEMCSLHLLADNTDLSLNSREWSALAKVVLQIQAIRQEYEAQIATSHEIAPGRYLLEIPAYAGMGDALREKFHTELRAELGEAKTTDVLAKLGGQLEGRFAGFGVSVQSLDITANSNGSFDDIEVKRTVTYWNSVDGKDTLTTRHEVHFPAEEDLSGDNWSALLARVKA